jgi:hypothetical protein
MLPPGLNPSGVPHEPSRIVQAYDILCLRQGAEVDAHLRKAVLLRQPPLVKAGTGAVVEGPDQARALAQGRCLGRARDVCPDSLVAPPLGGIDPVVAVPDDEPRPGEELRRPAAGPVPVIP